MRKKLVILAIGIAICIILGGYNSPFLFGTQYLDDREGYTFEVGDEVAWYDCNWSYAKKITIHHEYVDDNVQYFPVLIYNESDSDLAGNAQPDGDDIMFTDAYNLTQLDHELEYFGMTSGKLVAWVEVPYISHVQDTYIYMYYGNPDCDNQENIQGTWDSNFMMVQHFNESSGDHIDSTNNWNNGSVSGTIVQGTTESNLLQMDGLDWFSDGTGEIDFGNDDSLHPSTALTLEAWVKDPPLGSFSAPEEQLTLRILDKQNESLSLFSHHPFHIARTIQASKETLVRFIALFSEGIELTEMKMQNLSLYENMFTAQHPTSAIEQHIEDVRTHLPEEVTELPFIAYTNEFLLSDVQEILLSGATTVGPLSEKSGRISYLLIAEDGTYDVECTTHWTQPFHQIDMAFLAKVIQGMVLQSDASKEVYHESFLEEKTFHQAPLGDTEEPIISPTTLTLKPGERIVSPYATEMINPNDHTKKMQTISSARIAYYDDTNQLIPFDTKLVLCPSQEPDYWYGVEHNAIQSFFKLSPNLDAAIKFCHAKASLDPAMKGEGTLAWTPHSLSYTIPEGNQQLISSSLSVEGLPLRNTLTYDDIFGEGISLSYTTYSEQIKEYLTLDSPQVFPTINASLVNEDNITLDFSSTLQLQPGHSLWIYTKKGWSCWDQKTTVSTYGELRILDAEDHLIFRIPAASVQDSVGELFPCTTQLQRMNETILLSIQTSLAWLQDPMRLYPVSVDPSTSVSSSTSDGHIQAFVASGYDDAHDDDGSGVSVIDTGNPMNVGQYNVAGFDLIYRGYVYFDTSGIGAGNFVSDAELGLYGYGDDQSDTDFNIIIQKGITEDSPHDPLQQWDFYYDNYTGNGGSFNTSGWDDTNEYNEITLNASGLSWIDVEGSTRFCLRSHEDINDNATAAGVKAYLYFYQADYAGGAAAPKLWLNYSGPQPTITHPGPVNQSIANIPVPALNVTADDPDSLSIDVYWWSNSSGSWLQFDSNLSLATGVSLTPFNIKQNNENFSEEFTTYYWSVNATDGTYWTNASYQFTNGPPYVITENSLNTVSVSYPNARKLVRTSDKALHCVYTVYFGSKYHLNYSISRDNGKTWSETLLTPKAYTNFYPSIAVDNNDTIWVVWSGQHAGSTTYYQIRVMNYTTADGWSTITNITRDTADYQYYPAIAFDSKDQLHIVWHGQDARDNPIYYNIRHAIIYPWGTIGVVKYLTNVSNENQYRPAIAVDSDDNVHVVWYGQHAGSSTYNQIRYKKYSTASGWSINYNLTAESKSQQYPNIAIDTEDQLHVTWSAYPPDDNYYEIRYVNFTDGSWSRIYNVTDENDYEVYPSIAIDKGDNRHIGFTGETSGSANDRVRYINFTGDEASHNITNLTSNSNNHYYVNLIWANHPMTNVSKPARDYGCIWYNNTDALYFYRSPQLSWAWPVTVTTNTTTDVEETSVTFHGYLDDDGAENCTVRFLYTIVGLGDQSQSPIQYPMETGDEFEENQAGLSAGTFYQVYARANNSNYSDNGNAEYFLTKPERPANFNVTMYNQTQINLTWTTGDGANTTVVVRKKNTYPSDRSDGTVIYNGSLSNFEDTGLDQKDRYYYRAWSFSYWHFEELSGGDEYHWFSNSYVNGTARTDTLRMLSCSPDKSTYGTGDTVTFTASVTADIGTTVCLLICNSTSNLTDSNYTSRTSCLCNSSDIIITSQPQDITATMTVWENGSWWAKVCDSEGRNSYLQENLSSWNKTIASDWGSFYHDDLAFAIVIDSSDNVYIGGSGGSLNGSSGDDWWIKKFTDNGIEDLTNWNKTFSSGENDDDLLYDLALDSSDNLIAVGSGYCLNATPLSFNDWWIMAFDASGTRLMNQSYHGGWLLSSDVAHSVAVDSNDNFYVVGSGARLNSSTTNDDWWIMKFDGFSHANRLWNTTFTGYNPGGSGSRDIAYGACIDSSDDLIVVGTGQAVNKTSLLDYNWWIMKLDGSTGVQLWNITYDCGYGNDGKIYAVANDSNDDIYVVGYGENLNGSDSEADWWIMKFDSSTGAREWNMSYNSPEDEGDQAQTIHIDAHDIIYVGGRGQNLENSSWSSSDWWFKAFNLNAEEDRSEWNKTYDGNVGDFIAGPYDYAYDIATDSHQNIYLVGVGWCLNHSDSFYDWWIKKFEHFNGSFNVINETKSILEMSRSTYSLEMNRYGTKLYGFVDNKCISADIDTNWHYVALTYNGAQIRLYKDGNLEDIVYHSGAIGYSVTSTLYAGENLTGYLEEVRISNTARNGAWLNTTYNNTAFPTQFVSFGAPKGVLTTWTYRKKITIESDYIDETLTDFPILVYNSSDSDLADDALATGLDIIFMSASVDWSTGTWRDKFAHELEYFEPAAGTLIAWVRIPTVTSGSDTEFYMYYGNSICNADKQDPHGVWDDDYIMVQHMNESSGNILDSTAEGNDGTPTGTVFFNASAIIDGGYDMYDDKDSRFVVNNDNYDFNSNGFTVEAWVNWSKAMDTDDDEGDIFLYNANTGKATQNIWQLDFYYTALTTTYSVRLNTIIKSDIYTAEHAMGASPSLVGTTCYVVGVWDTDDLVLYCNKTKEATTSTEGNEFVNTMGIDWLGDDNTCFNGTLDEVRVSKTARNISWVKASCDAVSNVSDFLTFGLHQIQNVAPILSIPVPSNGATAQDPNPRLSITVNDNNSDTMDIDFRTNASGSWATIDSNASVTNGTYAQTPTSMTDYNTKYYWSINCSDGSAWTNQTFSFTTKSSVILRPNNAGRTTNLDGFSIGGEIDNYDCVNEEKSNGGSDYVYKANSATFVNDTYNLTDPPGGGGTTIDQVTVYINCTEFGIGGGGIDNEYKVVIVAKAGDSTFQYHESSEASTSPTWTEYSVTWTLNPATSAKWEWDEISTLEAGVALRGQIAAETRCTQVYVEVIYH